MKKNTPLTFLTATSIIGDKVENSSGESLGEIKDIMLNIADGNIKYYVIQFGGFLTMGEKYFAIPFRFLDVDAEKQIFILNQKREDLEKAPGFDKEHWPDTNVHTEEVDYYWGSFMGPNVGQAY
jgi:sporulation protein YlmC with PRC-barrel domain